MFFSNTMDSLEQKEILFGETFNKLFSQICCLEKKICNYKQERIIIKEGITDVKKVCADALGVYNQIRNNLKIITAQNITKKSIVNHICQTDMINEIEFKDVETQVNEIESKLPKKTKEEFNETNFKNSKISDGWTEVVRKKKNNKGNNKLLSNFGTLEKDNNHVHKFKNYAIVIKFLDVRSSARLVYRINNLLKNSWLSDLVIKSRCTKFGDYLLEIKKSNNFSEIVKILENNFGKYCKVQPKCNNKNFSIYGLNKFNSKNEVLDDLNKLSSKNKIDFIKINKIGQLKEGLNYANISVDGDFGNLLCKLKKIKVGFNICKIRENFWSARNKVDLCLNNPKAFCVSKPNIDVLQDVRFDSKGNHISGLCILKNK